MAYDKIERFKSTPVYYRFFDPGAYQYTNPPLIKPNYAPFLSKTPRDTKPCSTLWAHAIYNIELPKIIPNCTSLQSKIPRFQYEALTEEDIRELLCRCGLNNPCECPADEKDCGQTEEILCQGKLRRRLFIGLTPKTLSKRKKAVKYMESSPPFYETRVNESTAFYHGWKWSKRTSTRTQKLAEVRPGPAEYTIERKPDPNAICAEKVRERKRKTCTQLRYLDLIHQECLREKRPGPATYNPMLPKVTDMQFLGPKADRFPVSKYEICPGPADHWIKRDFDVDLIPDKLCHAKLKSHAPFGVNGVRFKTPLEDGPSPASYDALYKRCLFVHCPTAPFGSSADRFKDIEDNDEDEPDLHIENNEYKPHNCEPTRTWQFKSHTIRMRPLRKKLNEPSPADLPQSKLKSDRSISLQYSSPFYSSERRFMHWHNDIPIHGKEKTPGPAYYCLEKYKCQSAVCHGPLYRSRRFHHYDSKTPAPNAYRVNRSIETVLSTHNQKLKDKIRNKRKFIWKPPADSVNLSLQEQQNKLLDSCIALLDSPNMLENSTSRPESIKSSTVDYERPKEKLLRCFLYSKQIKPSL